MKNTILLLGNGINNISNNKAWETLLNDLHENYYDPAISFDEIKNKSFPLVYEQIVMYQLRKHNTGIEKELKSLIAEKVDAIKPNKVMNEIIYKNYDTIITSNYEFTLIRERPAEMMNEGCIEESNYSIFRHYKVNGKTFWHLHGDSQNVKSINLGYDHYCGQLQRMRNYVTGQYKRGPEDVNIRLREFLLNRKYLNTNENYSWIDYFFKNNTTIKIIGLKLGFDEIDLWWLLTYRAKILFGHRIKEKHYNKPENNTVEYYIPEEFTLTQEFKEKKDFMEKMAIDVKIIPKLHNEDFYKKALGQ